MGRFDSKTFTYIAYVLLALYVANWVAIRMVWTKLPTLTKKEKLRMDEYKKYVKGTSKVRGHFGALDWAKTLILLCYYFCYNQLIEGDTLCLVRSIASILVLS